LRLFRARAGDSGSALVRESLAAKGRYRGVRPSGVPVAERFAVFTSDVRLASAAAPVGNLDAMASAERMRRTAGLDGLRALAALSVLCFHTWLYGFDHPYAITRDSVFDKVMFETRIGLVFFFVLSGYLLYRAFARAGLSGERRVDVRHYARRRIARIVPAYWVATVGAIVLLWGGRGTPGIRLPAVSDLPLFAVFGQNYSLDTIMRLNPVTWTLCVEAAFYVLLPLLGALAWRFGPRARGVQVALVAALIPLGLIWNAFVHEHGWNILASKALPAYLPYFAFGMLLAVWSGWRAERGDEPAGQRATTALVIGGFAIVAANSYWHATAAPRATNAWLAVLSDVPAGLGFALVVAAAVVGGGTATRWMSVRPLAWVGLVSYGVYMWHVPLILFARRMDALPAAYPLRLLVVVPPVLLVAAASWYLVERPFIARAARRRPAAREARRGGRAQAQLEAHAAP
jgi:peptidoglycan/LPS O-acetylase OafA/YrhL